MTSRSHARVRWALVVTAALLLIVPSGGCGGEACTEIGCNDQLTVRLPDDDWTGSAVELCIGDLCGTVSELDQAEQEIAGALDGVIVLDAGELIWRGSPGEVGEDAEVRIDVTSDSGGTGTRVAPEWEENRPNGDDCPPVCRVATIEMGA